MSTCSISYQSWKWERNAIHLAILSGYGRVHHFLTLFSLSFCSDRISPIQIIEDVFYPNVQWWWSTSHLVYNVGHSDDAIESKSIDLRIAKQMFVMNRTVCSMLLSFLVSLSIRTSIDVFRPIYEQIYPWCLSLTQRMGMPTCINESPDVPRPNIHRCNGKHLFNWRKAFTSLIGECRCEFELRRSVVFRQQTRMCASIRVYLFIHFSRVCWPFLFRACS